MFCRHWIPSGKYRLRGFKAKLDDWKLEMQVVREGLKTYDGQLKSSVRNIQIEDILGTVREMRIFLDPLTNILEDFREYGASVRQI